MRRNLMRRSSLIRAGHRHLKLRMEGIAMIKTALKNVSGMRHALEKIEQTARLHRHRVPTFQPNVRFQFEKGHYLIKTAADGEELRRCLELRFEVFHRELLKKKRTFGVDVDKLDLICDHLVIVDQRTNRVIGTYRLNCSKFTGQFYSAGEFNLGKLLELPGHKLELGRACIDKDYRNGAVITLLWRGIAEYLTLTDSSHLFGCASLKTTDPMEIGLVYKHLTQEGLIDHSYDVVPTKKFRVKKLPTILSWIEASPTVYDRAAIQDLVPALFMSYVRMGAKILGEPALDRDFQCIDFLTLLKMDELNPIFMKKYKV